MDYSTPIKKLLWNSKVQNLADVQLFICHLLLDLDLAFDPGICFHDYCDVDKDKPTFTNMAASYYDKQLERCVMICDEIPINIMSILMELRPELSNWFPEKNDEPIKRIEVKSISTGKVRYIAEYKSAFPLVSVIYSVDYSNGNKRCKKVGYGTVEDTRNVVIDCNNAWYDYTYKIYDNERKKHFTGVLIQDPNGSFLLNVDLDAKRLEFLGRNPK